MVHTRNTIMVQHLKNYVRNICGCGRRHDLVIDNSKKFLLFGDVDNAFNEVASLSAGTDRTE